ncbi:MAG: uL15m family ribosomal protein [Candidatus Pacearchaeota archaeon]
MKLVKRKRSRRFHGTRLWGKNSKKAKGSGNRGGKGMAGTGKRADQRKTYILRYYDNYFGKRGFKSKKEKKTTINIDELQDKLEKFIKEGKAKITNEGIFLNLEDYKILGRGDIKDKLIIKAYSFSKKAKEKIEKAGGKCENLKKE